MSGVVETVEVDPTQDVVITVRDVLNKVSALVEAEKALSPRQAKAFVHDKMSFTEFIERATPDGRDIDDAITRHNLTAAAVAEQTGDPR